MKRFAAFFLTLHMVVFCSMDTFSWSHHFLMDGHFGCLQFSATVHICVSILSIRFCARTHLLICPCGVAHWGFEFLPAAPYRSLSWVTTRSVVNECVSVLTSSASLDFLRLQEFCQSDEWKMEAWGCYFNGNQEAFLRIGPFACLLYSEALSSWERIGLTCPVRLPGI